MRSDEYYVRLEKLKTLKELGVEVFPYRYDRTHTIEELKGNFRKA